MNYDEVEELLQLQKQAYGCLLWIEDQMRSNNLLLTDLKAGRFADSSFCREWLTKNLMSLPIETRPADERKNAFAQLLASFFQTSFRIGVRRYWDEERVTLRAGLKQQAGRKHRVRMGARTTELKHYALRNLAADNNLDLADHVLEDRLPDDATLWTYVCELKRRTEFGSQGEPVHLLWQELNENLRTRLNAEMVWKARERLLEWMVQESVGTS